MSKIAPNEHSKAEISIEAVREQLESILSDPGFRSSKRSIQFLKFVVEKTINGEADQIKERTIGVEVFGRDPSYDTNEDHVVRTAAGELRKRLTIYYADERHRSELRMNLVPGSYVPVFKYQPLLTSETSETNSINESPDDEEPQKVVHQIIGHPLEEMTISAPSSRWRRMAWKIAYASATVLVLIFLGYHRLKPATAQELFWKPVLETPGTVLLAVGDVPKGPPISQSEAGQDFSIPIVQKTSSQIVPFGDAVTIARVLGELKSKGKDVIIRREGASSFADLREGPVVLIGAFNNEWSLRLTNQLRYSLAMDQEKHIIYIKDAKNPSARNWSWATNLPTGRQGGPGRPPLMDYALISRIWNSDTGHVVVVIGGLYTYGTESAGEFLTNPQLMQTIAKSVRLDDPHSNLQIVLGTSVTDDSAGPPRVLAVTSE
jgi:hypothetical protein